MFNFKKLFGKGKKEQPKVNTPVPDSIAEAPQASSGEVLPLIAPENSPWNIPLLDLRPITLSMISSSKDPQMATNAVSYGGEDGTVFWGQQPPFDKTIIPATNGKLRSHSLLHIAVARGDIDGIEKHINAGIPINTHAQDGLAPLHWAVAGPFEAMEKLLALGADPNVASLEGATPIMNAVQSNMIDKVNLLLQSGATGNHRDNRGFTALHRAAEMGHIDIVKVLLAHGADRSIEAEGGHTALSLAQTQNNAAIIELLS